MARTNTTDATYSLSSPDLRATEKATPFRNRGTGIISSENLSCSTNPCPLPHLPPPFHAEPLRVLFLDRILRLLHHHRVLE